VILLNRILAGKNYEKLRLCLRDTFLFIMNHVFDPIKQWSQRDKLL